MEALGERGPSWAGVPVQLGGLGERSSLIDAACATPACPCHLSAPLTAQLATQSNMQKLLKICLSGNGCCLFSS